MSVTLLLGVGLVGNVLRACAWQDSSFLILAFMESFFFLFAMLRLRPRALRMKDTHSALTSTASPWFASNLRNVLSFLFINRLTWTWHFSYFCLFCSFFFWTLFLVRILLCSLTWNLPCSPGWPQTHGSQSSDAGSCASPYSAPIYR